MRTTLALVIAPLIALLPACTTTPNNVIVLGMIHGEHRESDRYPVWMIEDAVRAIRPDAILAEIPPASMADAMTQYQRSGVITRGRVSRFPEYTDVVIPLQAELGYRIVPAAGWTPEIADERAAKMERWQTTRPDQMADVEAGFASIDERTAALGFAPDDAAFIHSAEYDAIVRDGVRPYNDLFNLDLGKGGWDNINAAHYVYIRDELDRRKGRGETLLIMFGAWHKHWFIDRLEERARREGDIRIVDPPPFWAYRASATPTGLH